ncbi:MAG: NifU N-terminal domain-containing protein [Bdellovibrionales bacterium]
MTFQPHFTVDDVLVRAQPTPNPYAVKFVANHAFKATGKATVAHPSEVPDSKLVDALFQIPGVKQLYLHQNVLTVNHEGAMEFDNFVDQVESVIKTRLPIHNPHFESENEEIEKRVSRKKIALVCRLNCSKLKISWIERFDLDCRQMAVI